jgi:hypothetical protein
VRRNLLDFRDCNLVGEILKTAASDSRHADCFVKTFTSFDEAAIAYQEEGEGCAVILSHGYGVDGL